MSCKENTSTHRRAASILNVLLFSLLDVGKMESYFHDFNNVQHQIQASEEIQARNTGNHSFYHFQIIEVNLMSRLDNNKKMFSRLKARMCEILSVCASHRLCVTHKRVIDGESEIFRTRLPSHQ